MKTAILITTLFFTTICASTIAQPVNKADTTKKATQTTVKAPEKPQYQLDPSRVYHVTLDLTGQEVFGLTGGLDGSLMQNEQISAKQASDYEIDNKSFAKLIRSQVGAQIGADYRKWKADTAATLKVTPGSKKNKTK